MESEIVALIIFTSILILFLIGSFFSRLPSIMEELDKEDDEKLVDRIKDVEGKNIFIVKDKKKLEWY